MEQTASYKMEAQLPERKRVRSLRFSVLDGSGYASMVGFAETYFIPLLLFLGATNVQVGLFAAVPQLFFAFAQFLGIVLVDRFMVRKRIVVGAVSVQLLFLLSILFILAYERLNPFLFIVLGVGYYAVNGVAIPPWNSLIGDLTRARDRGLYLGRRNGLAQLVMFASIVAAGVILDSGKAAGAEKWGFVAILGLAAAGRIVSAFALTRHFEVPYTQDRDAYFSFWQFVRRAPNSNFAHFVFFISLMNFSVQMAAPFFVVYMMRDLGFSYLEFMSAQGVFIATQFFAMRRWGAFADRFGNRAVIYISGAVVTFLPLLWFLSRSYAYIILIQVFAGLAWGGWFLGSANFIFDAVTPPKRARCAAYMNFFHSAGFFCGTLFGAWLSMRAPRVIDTGAMSVVLLSPLQFLFLVSSGLRLIILLVFAPSIREVRTVANTTPREMFMFLAHVKPLSGVRFLPFTGHGKHHENGNSSSE